MTYPCPGCGKECKSRASFSAHCTHDKTCTQEARFWGRVIKNTPTGCWLWTGLKDASGYGRTTKAGPLTYAHRRAWIYTNGPVPEGMDVCHHCDVRNCCNPSHMFLGTHDDNMKDRSLKGRGVALSEEKVREIRAKKKAGARSMDLIREYGVSTSAIYEVLAGRSWKWVR